MKNLLILIPVLTLVGCGILTKPVITQQPMVTPASTNTVLSTNIPSPTVSLAVTNGLITYITNTPPPQIIRQVIVLPAQTNYMTVTNYIPNPSFLSGVEVAQQVNSVANPTPSAPLVNIGLMGLTGLASLLAAWQNRKSNKAIDVATTMVKAIEGLPPELTQPVKDAVAKMSQHRDNAKDVNDIVKKVT